MDNPGQGDPLLSGALVPIGSVVSFLRVSHGMGRRPCRQYRGKNFVLWIENASPLWP